jgi:hypothetical protein
MMFMMVTSRLDRRMARGDHCHLSDPLIRRVSFESQLAVAT